MPRKLILVLVTVIFLLSSLMVAVSCSQPAPEPSPTPTPETPIVPGKSLPGAARVTFNDHIELKAGGMKQIDITLETLEHGPGEVFYTIDRVAEEYSEDKLPLSEDLGVSISPAVFMAEPNNIYHTMVLIYTTTELAPGEYTFLLTWNFEGVERGSGWITVNVE